MISSTSPAALTPDPLRRLPLHELHVAQGARMEPFAGWTMPIHYGLGVLGEHRHTRAAAGLFDVSHMGQILLRARSGQIRDAALALEALVPADVVSLRPGRQRYAFFTTPSGGIRDDLMIANLDTCLYLVVNAACMASDVAYLRERLSAQCTVEVLSDRALLAIQGPKACAALAALVPMVAAMRFMDADVFSIEGASCFIARSGYTGEDGFEISVPAALAATIAEQLLVHPSVKLVGLGARDSLRLESGLCLYGHDLTTDTTPVEAALEWAIQPARRVGGARAGGFPGSEIILSQLAHGAARKRVGLRPDARPVREGAALFADSTSTAALGRVTSGTYAPSAQCPVAMGYVPASVAQVGTRLYADVRGQRIPVTLSDMPFVPHRYRR
ncbi:MAG: glycine cleavage system aminomethyltransferase GcvT [Steroidobacteraceae bacterium]